MMNRFRKARAAGCQERPAEVRSTSEPPLLSLCRAAKHLFRKDQSKALALAMAGQAPSKKVLPGGTNLRPSPTAPWKRYLRECASIYFQFRFVESEFGFGLSGRPNKELYRLKVDRNVLWTG